MTDRTDPESKAVLDNFFGPRARGEEIPRDQLTELLIKGGPVYVRDSKGQIHEVIIPDLGEPTLL